MEILKKIKHLSNAKKILTILVLFYAFYFSGLTISRYHSFHASYFDLGIMHQAVHNTYRAVTTGDWSRFLEMTKPAEAVQFSRLAVHNDPLLVLLVPFYFIYDGPETLLIIQALVVALGAIAVFGIGRAVFGSYANKDWIALAFAAAYLMYPPMHRGNAFEMHAFTLVTTILLFVWYFVLERRFRLGLLFIFLALLTKENVGLSLAALGIYWLFRGWQRRDHSLRNFGIAAAILSFVWFALSVFVITPHFRAPSNSGEHFATKFYAQFGETPGEIMTGVFAKPGEVLRRLAYPTTKEYLFQTLGPFGLFSLAAPLELLPALPEFAINLLSANYKMRTTGYHYTALIEFFVVISAIYGAKRILETVGKEISKRSPERGAIAWLLVAAIGFTYFNGLLPFSKDPVLKDWRVPLPVAAEALEWKEKLADEDLKLSVTHDVAPLFAGRRYLYNPGPTYELADYVIISSGEAAAFPAAAVREAVQSNKRFQKVHGGRFLEVYKKIK